MGLKPTQICIPLLAAFTLAAAFPSVAAQCPPLLSGATRVLLVTSPDMQHKTAELRRYERPDPMKPWHEIGGTSPAVVGSSGLGWAPGSEDALAGEPAKHEGDKRTPAGVFRLGNPFGTGASSAPGYLHLAPDRNICVDDLTSSHYGQIVSRRDFPTVRGEDMGRVSLYRRGFVVDYPVDAAQRGGSCIFLHVWRSPTKGTVGCVALPEPDVATLQDWAKPGDVIAILPERSAGKLLSCLGDH